MRVVRAFVLGLDERQVLDPEFGCVVDVVDAGLLVDRSVAVGGWHDHFMSTHQSNVGDA